MKNSQQASQLPRQWGILHHSHPYPTQICSIHKSNDLGRVMWPEQRQAGFRTWYKLWALRTRGGKSLLMVSLWKNGVLKDFTEKFESWLAQETYAYTCTCDNDPKAIHLSICFLSFWDFSEMNRPYCIVNLASQVSKFLEQFHDSSPALMLFIPVTTRHHSQCNKNLRNLHTREYEFYSIGNSIESKHSKKLAVKSRRPHGIHELECHLGITYVFWMPCQGSLCLARVGIHTWIFPPAQSHNTEAVHQLCNAKHNCSGNSPCSTGGKQKN